MPLDGEPTSVTKREIEFDPFYPKSIRSYPYKGQWKLPYEEKSMGTHFSRVVQEKISGLTGACLSQEGHPRIIFIGAKSKQDCDRSLGKLDTIFKYQVWPHISLFAPY